MKAFRPYVERLEDLAMSSSTQLGDWTQRVATALNGEPGRELAQVLSLRTRRKMGAFFTGEILAQQAIPHFNNSPRYAIVFDPACGVGDLLLAAARLLPVRKSLQATLDLWGARLAGCDTNPEFVRATKSRLVLMARQRITTASKTKSLDLRSIFPLIRVCDGLTAIDRFTTVTWVVLNPPYGYVEAPEGCRWASGKLTAAAIFFDACLRHSSVGTRITAVLPDVLRSGTRYEKWRAMVANQCEITRAEPYGLFDRSADVDVFILDVTKRAIIERPRNGSWFRKRVHGQTTVHDLFVVHVGSVVPHRHLQRGLRVIVPYIHARAMPPWGRVRRINERRRFRGSLFRPPFVVIRRTSRPEDTYRATCTLVTGSRPVAVENHLVICQPHDGQQQTCERLMAKLKTEKVNKFLNYQMRCRHLTVDVVKRIPLHYYPKSCR